MFKIVSQLPCLRNLSTKVDGVLDLKVGRRVRRWKTTKSTVISNTKPARLRKRTRVYGTSPLLRLIRFSAVIILDFNQSIPRITSGDMTTRLVITSNGAASKTHTVRSPNSKEYTVPHPMRKYPIDSKPYGFDKHTLYP